MESLTGIATVTKGDRGWRTLALKIKVSHLLGIVIPGEICWINSKKSRMNNDIMVILVFQDYENWIVFTWPQHRKLIDWCRIIKRLFEKSDFALISTNNLFKNIPNLKTFYPEDHNTDGSSHCCAHSPLTS